MTARELLDQLRAAVAEFGGDTPVCRVPMKGPLPDSGYDATKPIPAGSSKQALVLHPTATGCVLSLTAKQDGADDHQRTILKRMYGNRARVIRETGTFPGTDTRQLTENDTDD